MQAATPRTVREQSMRNARLPEVLRARVLRRPEPYGGAGASVASPTDSAIVARVGIQEMSAPHWQLHASTPLSSNPVSRDNVEPPAWLWG